MKICNTCGEEKPLSEYHKHARMKDGHLNRCKVCNNEKLRKYRQTDTYKAIKHKYTQSEKGITTRNKWHTEYRKIAEVKRKRKAVNAARFIKERQPCEVCGDENTEKHHDDYDKPLEVRWLCFKHHRQLHGQFKELADALRQ